MSYIFFTVLTTLFIITYQVSSQDVCSSQCEKCFNNLLSYYKFVDPNSPIVTNRLKQFVGNMEGYAGTDFKDYTIQDYSFFNLYDTSGVEFYVFQVRLKPKTGQYYDAPTYHGLFSHLTSTGLVYYSAGFQRVLPTSTAVNTDFYVFINFKSVWPIE